MKILLVNSFLHPRGGDTTCVYTSWKGLTARGHTVIPFAMRHASNEPSPWEVRFPPQLDAVNEAGLARLGAAVEAIWSRRAANALEALLRDHRPDVAHLHHVHRHLSPSVLAPLARAGVPVVWTLHDYELLCPNGMLFTHGAPCERCRGHRYAEAVTHRCKRDDTLASVAVAVEKWTHAALGVTDRVARFIAPSRFLAQKLLDFGFAGERVVHIPNPAEDPGPPGPAGENVVYAGRLAPEKGLRILADVARAMPERRFDVYGEGPERACLAGLPNVVTHGAVAPAVVAEALRLAGAAIVPSVWPENLPYAVIEAQLAARPVVASAVGGIPEQISTDDGVLVTPGDVKGFVAGLRGVFSDAALRARLGAAGRQRALAAYAPELHITRLEALYATLS